MPKRKRNISGKVGIISATQQTGIHLLVYNTKLGGSGTKFQTPVQEVMRSNLDWGISVSRLFPVQSLTVQLGLLL